MPTPNAETLISIFNTQRSAYLKAGAPSYDQRIHDLEQLKHAVVSHRDAFVAAISSDFGNRSRQETVYMDLGPVVAGIDHIKAHLKDWMQPLAREVSADFAPATARVVYQPLGVVGIIAPWNYPVALALMPLATAIAAGNRAMIKPSEFTPATSELMLSILAEIFPQDQVAVIIGEAEIAAAFSALPFDHILFTGSGGVGRVIMRAASANLVPVTLELGGKSPVVIERGSSLLRAAHSIAWGKLGNGGQTCIAPDYVLVADDEIDAFKAAFISEAHLMYPDIANNQDYASVITDRHYQRLTALVEDAKSKGAEVEIIGSDNNGKLHARTFLPVVLSKLTEDMNVLKEEIFGAILPIIPYATIDDAVAYINARPRPLALYYFGTDGAERDQVLTRTTSGNVSINETLLHYAQDDIPFGGIGESGMGAYHGPEGFKRLSHAKGIFEQSDTNHTDILRAPFGPAFDAAIYDQFK